MGNLADTGSNLLVDGDGMAAFASAIGRGKPGARSCAIDGPVSSNGYNAVAGTRCRLGDGPGDQVHRETLGLNPLIGGQGPTPTRRPGGGRLSIVPLAACTVLTIDQRGAPRPQGSFCEAGSVEVPYP